MLPKIVFEDDLTKFPYALIRDSMPNELYGTKGNTRVNVFERTVGYDNSIVYIDVSPDNPSTHMWFKMLQSKSANTDNMYVIPIPNIEHYFIRTFFNNNSMVYGTVCNFENYRIMSHNDRGRLLSTTSYEKFCKSVIDNELGCYEARMFEYYDCLCGRKYMRDNCKSISLADKRMDFINSIPGNMCFNMDIKSSEFKECIKLVQSECYALHTKMLRNFLKYGVIPKGKYLSDLM